MHKGHLQRYVPRILTHTERALSVLLYWKISYQFETDLLIKLKLGFEYSDQVMRSMKIMLISAIRYLSRERGKHYVKTALSSPATYHYGWMDIIRIMDYKPRVRLDSV